MSEQDKQKSYDKPPMDKMMRKPGKKKDTDVDEAETFERTRARKHKRKRR